MSYIGNIPTTVAFLVDTFSGDGSDTTFTLSQAPATTSSILVAVSGVVQDPSTYSVSGTTLTFSGAPPSGSSNISVRFLGVPASGVATTAYRTLTTFTATSGQTTFSVPSYTVGYIDVYRNGVKLGTADFTATSGTSVVLASGATAGDLVETISFYVSSVLNAIPAVANAVTETYINDGAVTKAKMAASGAWAPAGTVIQVVNAVKSDQFSTTSSSYVDVTGYSASITPSSSSSKILILVNCSLSGSSTSEATIAVYRGATLVTNTNITRVASVDYGASISYLDSPATTSSTTYQIKTKANVSTSTINQNSDQDSFITLMEIAG
jgi:Pyruvate/2-oxoacid:ferredoxin oxidoreductase gamma subunit